MQEKATVMAVRSGDRRVQRSKLSDQIAEIIRNDVLTGRLAPGERVGQAQWADRVGASRMPVRDAINQLCAEGLLVQDETGSATVATVDPADIRDGYLLNAFVASMAARRAAERITESELNELDGINDAMKRAVDDGDRELASHLNWSFHAAINRAARSARLLAVLRNLATSIPHSAFEMLDSWPQQAYEEHRELLARLRARDGEQAAELMQHHIEAGSAPMIGELERRLRTRGTGA
jgi:DNA-binding GntR family transcriptional regulator